MRRIFSGQPRMIPRCLVCIFLLHLHATFALRLIEVKVPPHKTIGGNATLVCNFSLEGDTLYSVKWYKGGNEFFRYVPQDAPPWQVFPVAGIRVNLSKSNRHQVVLMSMDLDSTGTYRCEVSAEAPSFQTVFSHHDMIVVDLPDESPKITGGQSKYHLGDNVNVNCTSYKSKPAASLMWYINGKQADDKYLKEYLPVEDSDGLETSVLGLHFPVKHHHFASGNMKLKCTATIATLYWKSDKKVVQGVMTKRALESRDPDASGQEKIKVSSTGSILIMACLYWLFG